MNSDVKPLIWKPGELLLLDQRILPHREEWVTCHSAADVETAIRDMVVRGAPAIGVAAAYGIALEAIHSREDDLKKRLETAALSLRGARPWTIVNASRRWDYRRCRNGTIVLPVIGIIVEGRVTPGSDEPRPAWTGRRSTDR